MATAEGREFTTEDFTYLNHGGVSLAMRLFRPTGAGPFPVVLNLHGGAWCNGDLNECRKRDEAIARAGIASAALDFRHADDGYPSSLVDINYASRWLKREAKRLHLDEGRVGIAGQSSGGHLAMLAAMRPCDARYLSVPLTHGDREEKGVDASVRCVAMTWPVINPLARYRHALRARAGNPPATWVGDIPARHERYWKSEANMQEGNPTLALERGEPVRTPPAIWIQGRPDPVHDFRDTESELSVNEPERFTRRYREAGGRIEVVHIEQRDRAEQSLAPLTAFLREQLL